MDQTLLISLGGQVGAIIGVLASKPGEGLGLTLGLVVNMVGEMLLGSWLALILAIATIAGMSRTHGLKRSWGFAVGMVGGKIAGRCLGLFLLGPGGVTVGESLAQQMAAVAGWKVTEET